MYYRSMTVHRGSRSPARNRRREEERPLTFLENVTAFTALQIFLSLLVLAGAFTLQFVDGERYHRLGSYYRSVMGRAGADAVEVGAFGEPIAFPDLLRELEKTVMGQIVQEPKDSPQEPQGMGGRSPYVPENLYQGEVLVSAPARYPVYGTMTSPFGPREHPVLEDWDFHTGLDIAAPEGADIYAAYPGRVAQVGQSEIYGNFLTMDHGGGLTTTYCHCSLILAKEGQRLQAGARIAEVGSTGMVTGPHLHFEARVDGDLIQPLCLFDL